MQTDIIRQAILADGKETLGSSWAASRWTVSRVPAADTDEGGKLTGYCVVIKSGGYKISALDIEREILGLNYISEVSVVGVADEDFGQRVAALIVPRTQQDITITQLRNDLRSSLSGYKLPTLLCVMEDLPKTASGKVQKAAIRERVFESRDFEGVIQRFVPRKVHAHVAKSKL